MTVKMDFLISPAYWVPPMRTSFWPKWMTMKTSEWVPSTSGMAWKLGALMTVNCGTWLGQLLGLGLDEHVAGEEGVPGGLGDHPDGHAISGVGPGKAVLDKEVFALEIGQQPVLQRGKPLRFHGLVHRAPPDFVFTGGLPHDKLVVGGAPGMLAGAHHQRAQVGHAALPAPDDLLVQERCREIPVNKPRILDTVLFQAISAGELTFHKSTPLKFINPNF